MKLFTGNWPFFYTGCTIAFLFILSLYLLNTPVGMSEAYLMMSEYCGEVIKERNLEEWPLFDWQTGFLGGIFIGAFVAVLVNGEWKFEFFPEDRKNKGFFPAIFTSPIRGIVGGFMVMFGLQLAGDSFLGQWASAIQLSTGAWLFLSATLLSGVFASAVMSMKMEKGDS